MADSSSLVTLLDRASHAFSLAGKLGHAFQDEQKARALFYDPSTRTRLAPAFDEFCQALLDLRDVMANPPDGFAPVTEPLLEAARIAKGMRETVLREKDFTTCLEDFPELMTVCQSGWAAVKHVAKGQRLDDPFAFVDDLTGRKLAQQPFTLLNQYPATPAGHIAFLDFVAQEVYLAAVTQQNQLTCGYSDALIESRVQSIKWLEARGRLSALTDLPDAVRAHAAEILQRDLNVGTVQQIHQLITPAVLAIQSAHEQARLAELAEKSIVVNTVGDLWKVLAEGHRPCFVSSGISLRRGANTLTITCANPADEARRITLDRALAIVTVEGVDKAAAMEKLIARVQLQKRMDKASVINLPLADFVAIISKISANSTGNPPENTPPEPPTKTPQELDAERLQQIVDGMAPQPAILIEVLWNQRFATKWAKLPAKAFREGPATQSGSIFEALKSLQKLCTKNYDSWGISISISKAKETVQLSKKGSPQGGK